VADPGLSERGRFRQGHRDAEDVDGNKVWGGVFPSTTTTTTTTSSSNNTPFSTTVTTTT